VNNVYKKVVVKPERVTGGGAGSFSLRCASPDESASA
jgi:hypothetical protein